MRQRSTGSDGTLSNKYILAELVSNRKQ